MEKVKLSFHLFSIFKIFNVIYDEHCPLTNISLSLSMALIALSGGPRCGHCRWVANSVLRSPLMLWVSDHASTKNKTLAAGSATATLLVMSRITRPFGMEISEKESSTKYSRAMENPTLSIRKIIRGQVLFRRSFHSHHLVDFRRGRKSERCHPYIIVLHIFFLYQILFILITDFCPLQLTAQSRQLKKMPRETELTTDVLFVLCYKVFVASWDFINNTCPP